MSKKAKLSSNGLISRRSFVCAFSAALANCAVGVMNPLPAYGERSIFVEDSLGRTFSFEEPPLRICPYGVYAQTLLEELIPSALVSVAKDISCELAEFDRAGIGYLAELPVLSFGSAGALYDPALSEIDSVDVDCVIQAGIPDDGLRDALDRLQADAGVPCFFVDVSFGCLSEAYRKLGSLLGCAKRAEILANYIDSLHGKFSGVAGESSCEYASVFYAPRVAGRKVTRATKVQIDAISFLGLNAVTSPYDLSARDINFAFLENQRADLVIYDDLAFADLEKLSFDDSYFPWRYSSAVKNGNFAVSPALFHSFFGSAVFAQSLGLIWLTRVVSSALDNGELVAEIKEFYQLFYHLELSEDEVLGLLTLAN